MEDLQRVHIIEEGLVSQFWKEIIVPLLNDRLEVAQKAWRDPSLTRKHKLPDDYLRGAADLAELLLSQPALIAETTRQAAIEENVAKERDLQDDVIAHYGRGSFIED